MEKVTIIGAGQVGMTAAFYLAEKRVASIQLIDEDWGRAQGTAIDLFEAAPIRAYDGWIKGSGNVKDVKGSKAVVLTSGLDRGQGSPCPDRILSNLEFVQRIMKEVRKASPNAVLINLIEPVDLFCYTLVKSGGWNPMRVLGVSNVLDSTRFRQLIASELNLSSVNSSAIVLGSCNCRIILPRYARIEGIPIHELLMRERIESLMQQVQSAGGANGASGCGGTIHEAGAAVADIVESVVRDQGRILCGPAFLRGEYGYSEICLGVPLVVGRRGIHRIIELDLTEEEKALLDHAAEMFRTAADELPELRKPWPK